MNFGYFIMGVVFILGIFATVSLFDQLDTTGAYYYGQAGMGRYYAAGGWAQFTPKEACEYAGGNSFDPPEVFLSDMNAYMVACYRANPYSEGDRFAAPLIRWISPKPLPDTFRPIP